MPSFSFPPPPPPPPRASASDDSPNATHSQRGAFNHIRGARGGRGARGRGRGDVHCHRGGSQRGGHGSYQNYQPSTRQRAQGQLPAQAHLGSRQLTTSDANTTMWSTTPTSVPTGAYVNPSFVPQLQWGGPAQTPVNPMAFAQALSYMNSQTGVHSMPTPVSDPSNGHQPHHQMPRPHTTSISPPLGKRKRDSTTRASQQPRSKPQKAKVDVAPAVPSFGFALPVAPKPSPPTKSQNDKPSSKRTSNQLGLTPQGEHFEASDEDADEEATFAANGESFIFEHGDQMISLANPAQVAEWIKERKKKFPTKARIEEKAKEVAAKRARELETIRRVKEQAAGGRGQKKAQTNGLNRIEQRPGAENEEVRKKRSMEKHQKKIEKLRQKLQRSEKKAAKAAATESQTATEAKEVTAEPFMLSKKDKALPDLDTGLLMKEAPELHNEPTRLQHAEVVQTTAPIDPLNLGINYSSDTSLESDLGSSIDSETSSVVSSSDSDSGSDSGSSDSSDSDSAPEEQSTKQSNIPPLADQHPNVSKDTIQHAVCPHWKRTGKCKFGKGCRWPHPPLLADGKPKRMKLFDRMVEQELKAADGLALQAIKYLGGHGFLD